MRDPRGSLMQSQGLREQLTDRLSAAAGQDAEAVEMVVRAVFSTMHGDLSSKETSLLAEVEELARTIATAKAEIAALRVDDITDNHIPSATDELDAIVAHTASATNSILEVCESLDNLAEKMTGEASVQLADATTKIYEACGFQDITGQRISKIVMTLKTIDEKVATILSAFGVESSPDNVMPVEVDTSDAALLNGPQLPMAAMDQAEIDRLMADF